MRYLCLLSVIVLAGCSKGPEKPVAMSQQEMESLQGSNWDLVRLLANIAKLDLKATIHNPTNKPVASIDFDLCLFDADGNQTYGKRMTWTTFIHEGTGYIGPLLPHSTALAKVALKDEKLREIRSIPSWYMRIKAGTFSAPSEDLNEIPNWFAAIARGDTASVKKALDANSSLAVKIEPGSHAAMIHIAAAANNEELVQEALFRGAKLDQTTKNGNTPLYIALNAGANDAAMLLIAKDARIDHSVNGLSALQLAAKSASIDVVKAIVERGGAEINSRAEFFDSPLGRAAERGDPEIVKYLLSKGAYPNTRDLRLGTPLIRAMYSANEAVVTLLLASGANINDQYRDGVGPTPLIVAAQRGNTKMVKLLLSRGANRDIRDFAKRTALDYAKMKWNQEMIAVLEKG